MAVLASGAVVVSVVLAFEPFVAVAAVAVAVAVATVTLVEVFALVGAVPAEPWWVELKVVAVLRVGSVELVVVLVRELSGI